MFLSILDRENFENVTPGFDCNAKKKEKKRKWYFNICIYVHADSAIEKKILPTRTHTSCVHSPVFLLFF